MPDLYKCKHCKKIKPRTVEYFYGDQSCADDLRTICKECEIRRVMAKRARQQRKYLDYQKGYRKIEVPV